jgi:DNA-binding transcriptional MerR regulator
MLYTAVVPPAGRLRIGELSRRSGVSPELLRAWERRYGLLQPVRSSGGLRLYSADDLERVLAMQQHLAEGLAAAEAAALATQPRVAAQSPPHDAAVTRQELAAALDRFDEARAHAVFDGALAAATTDWLVSDVILPYLRDLGDRWERGEVTVAQEHFASGLLRGRLLGLARGWGSGFGPRALLACAPREQHDLGLIAFGLALRARGWRIVYLGPDTPIESVVDGARFFEPDFVVVSAVATERFSSIEPDLQRLAKAQRLCLGGSGAADGDVRVDALRLTGDPVQEAERLTDLVRPPEAA